MSVTLYYEPVPPKEKPLPNTLRYAIEKRGYEITTAGRILTEIDLEFLRGLSAAGLEDAEKLIEAIETYGQVRIKIQ